MSNKTSLKRAVVLSLLLAVSYHEIVLAAPGQDSEIKNEAPALGSGGIYPYSTDTGGDATDTLGERGGNAGNLTVQATVNSNIVQDITVEGTAGSGGNSADNGSSSGGVSGQDVGNAGKGGNSSVSVATAQGTLAIQMKNINIKASAGSGGLAGASYRTDSNAAWGGMGGSAAAYGLNILSANGVVQVLNMDVRAMAGVGGAGGNQYSDGSAGSGGSGGNAAASGLEISGSEHLTITTDNISVTTGSGSGGVGGNALQGGYGVDDKDGAGGTGGDSIAYGLRVSDSEQLNITSQQITINTVSGAGGNGGRVDYNAGSNGRDGGNGGNAGNAAAYAIYVYGNKQGVLKTDSITIDLKGGQAGSGGTSNAASEKDYYGNGGNTGDCGHILAEGIYLAASDAMSIHTQDLNITVHGGDNSSSAGSSYKDAGHGGTGGLAETYGIHILASKGNVTTGNIKIKTTAGSGTNGGISYSLGHGGIGGSGGVAVAYALLGKNSTVDVSMGDIVIDTAAGIAGNGGNSGGSSGVDGGQGGNGGAADSYGIGLVSGTGVVTTGSITVTATAGNGGNGGNGGSGGTYFSKNAGNGGAGGDGGAATAWGIYTTESSKLNVTTDSISASATGGIAGTGAIGGTGYGDGQDGKAGLDGIDGTATAYGVYASSGATVKLYANTGSAVDIGTTATGTNAKAYAVYAADGAQVLFGSSANLNKDKDLNIDNNVVSYLSNATLGFVDTAAGIKATARTVKGGTLQLAGSNIFRFATDLAKDVADSMTYNSLGANSTGETQYITIAYDKGFDGSSLSTITGNATVLHFDNLNGNDLIKFEAKQSEFDTPLESFTAKPIIQIEGNNINVTGVDFGQNGPSESVMAISDAHMALCGIWRAETNNLMKRMGELRSDPEADKGGVWARYYRGKQSANGAYARSFEQTYTGFQGGIDHAQAYKDGRLVTGLMVNRIDATASYHAGNGEMSSTGMGLYASWLGNKGHYLDVIARMSKLNNNFKLTDKSGNFASGDYSTWAYGISAEYGYRQQLQAGWFIEPQAELTFSHINSADYTMSNGLQAKHDAVNSAIGRIGFMTGKTFQANGRAGNAYIKASLLHEFGGTSGGQAYYQGKGIEMANGNLGGTWYELGLGANLGLSKNANLYMDALKTFNGKIKTDWQFNAGVRVSF